ncbi:hypothetical protein [Glutamicibacter nicotianae]|uniref:hypothetical protein n=1 Tax=Glutamicibacter nicotianae TaxID=37929 RepID=UPI00167F4E35|nr:hypothetical protein [Glutamicibacter nicotianae]MDV2979013.1 hypothetical protein [Actinomycetes bacterium ARC8]
MSEKLLKELIDEVKRLHDTIQVMQEDINCIRNGEYDKPGGADKGWRNAKPVIRPASDQPLKTSRDW